MSTPSNDSQSAEYLANLKLVEDFDNQEQTPPNEGLYDRVLGVSRNPKTGEVEAVLKSAPDETGQTQLYVKSAADIKRELGHDSNAQMSPGFYDNGMKRSGKTDSQIADFHENNEDILHHADKMITEAQPQKDTLPTTDAAIAKYNAPGYTPPAVDSDYVKRPAFNNEPAYTKTVGIAKNMDGKPAALLETAPDTDGKKTLVAMTEEQLNQQIDHDRSSQANGGMSDPGLINQAHSEGLGAAATEDRITALHAGNEKVLSDARNQMKEAERNRTPLPSVQEMAQQHQTTQNTSAEAHATPAPNSPTSQSDQAPANPQPTAAPTAIAPKAPPPTEAELAEARRAALAEQGLEDPTHEHTTGSNALPASNTPNVARGQSQGRAA